MIPSCAIVGMGGGAAAPTITLTTTSAYKARIGVANATYKVAADGSVYKNTDPSVFENWISDPSAAGDYQVRATLVSGTSPTGSALSSWLALTSDRSWTLSNSAEDGSEVSCVLTVEISDIATTTVRATATITITAVSNP